MELMNIVWIFVLVGIAIITTNVQCSSLSLLRRNRKVGRSTIKYPVLNSPTSWSKLYRKSFEPSTNVPQILQNKKSKSLLTSGQKAKENEVIMHETSSDNENITLLKEYDLKTSNNNRQLSRKRHKRETDMKSTQDVKQQQEKKIIKKSVKKIQHLIKSVIVNSSEPYSALVDNYRLTKAASNGTEYISPAIVDELAGIYDEDTSELFNGSVSDTKKNLKDFPAEDNKEYSETKNAKIPPSDSIKSKDNSNIHEQLKTNNNFPSELPNMFTVERTLFESTTSNSPSTPFGETIPDEIKETSEAHTLSESLSPDNARVLDKLPEPSTKKSQNMIMFSSPIPLYNTESARKMVEEYKNEKDLLHSVSLSQEHPLGTINPQQNNSYENTSDFVLCWVETNNVTVHKPKGTKEITTKYKVILDGPQNEDMVSDSLDKSLQYTTAQSYTEEEEELLKNLKKYVFYNTLHNSINFTIIEKITKYCGVGPLIQITINNFVSNITQKKKRRLVINLFTTNGNRNFWGQKELLTRGMEQIALVNKNLRRYHKKEIHPSQETEKSEFAKEIDGSKMSLYSRDLKNMNDSYMIHSTYKTALPAGSVEILNSHSARGVNEFNAVTSETPSNDDEILVSRSFSDKTTTEMSTHTLSIISRNSSDLKLTKTFENHIANLFMKSLSVKLSIIHGEDPSLISNEIVKALYNSVREVSSDIIKNSLLSTNILPDTDLEMNKNKTQLALLENVRNILENNAVWCNRGNRAYTSIEGKTTEENKATQSKGLLVTKITESATTTFPQNADEDHHLDTSVSSNFGDMGYRTTLPIFVSNLPISSDSQLSEKSLYQESSTLSYTQRSERNIASQNLENFQIDEFKMTAKKSFEDQNIKLTNTNGFLTTDVKNMKEDSNNFSQVSFTPNLFFEYTNANKNYTINSTAEKSILPILHSSVNKDIKEVEPFTISLDETTKKSELQSSYNTSKGAITSRNIQRADLVLSILKHPEEYNTSKNHEPIQEITHKLSTYEVLEDVGMAKFSYPQTLDTENSTDSAIINLNPTTKLYQIQPSNPVNNNHEQPGTELLTYSSHRFINPVADVKVSDYSKHTEQVKYVPSPATEKIFPDKELEENTTYYEEYIPKKYVPTSTTERVISRKELNDNTSTDKEYFSDKDILTAETERKIRGKDLGVNVSLYEVLRERSTHSDDFMTPATVLDEPSYFSHGKTETFNRDFTSDSSTISFTSPIPEETRKEDSLKEQPQEVYLTPFLTPSNSNRLLDTTLMGYDIFPTEKETYDKVSSIIPHTTDVRYESTVIPNILRPEFVTPSTETFHSMKHYVPTEVSHLKDDTYAISTDNVGYTLTLKENMSILNSVSEQSDLVDNEKKTVNPQHLNQEVEQIQSSSMRFLISTEKPEYNEREDKDFKIFPENPHEVTRTNYYTGDSTPTISSPTYITVTPTNDVMARHVQAVITENTSKTRKYSVPSPVTQVNNPQEGYGSTTEEVLTTEVTDIEYIKVHHIVLETRPRNEFNLLYYMTKFDPQEMQNILTTRPSGNTLKPIANNKLVQNPKTPYHSTTLSALENNYGTKIQEFFSPEQKFTLQQPNYVFQGYSTRKSILLSDVGDTIARKALPISEYQEEKSFTLNKEPTEKNNFNDKTLQEKRFNCDAYENDCIEKGLKFQTLPSYNFDMGKAGNQKVKRGCESDQNNSPCSAKSSQKRDVHQKSNFQELDVVHPIKCNETIGDLCGRRSMQPPKQLLQIPFSLSQEAFQNLASLQNWHLSMFESTEDYKPVLTETPFRRIQRFPNNPFFKLPIPHTPNQSTASVIPSTPGSFLNFQKYFDPFQYSGMQLAQNSYELYRRYMLNQLQFARELQNPLFKNPFNTFYFPTPMTKSKYLELYSQLDPLKYTRRKRNIR